MPYKDPARRRDYQNNRNARIRALKQDTRARIIPPDPVRVQDAQDLFDLLCEELAFVRSDPTLSTPQLVRAVTSLSGKLLQAHEAAAVEARLAALEARLKGRRKP